MAKDEVISPLLMNMIKPFLPGLIQKVSSVGPFLKTQIEAIESDINIHFKKFEVDYKFKYIQYKNEVCCHKVRI